MAFLVRVIGNSTITSESNTEVSDTEVLTKAKFDQRKYYFRCRLSRITMRLPGALPSSQPNAENG